MKEKESITAISASNTVTLLFKVWAPDFNRVDHRLFLLGSLKQMGAWNINEAVEAFPTTDLHVWKAEVRNIPAQSLFEWVWLKTKSNRSQIQWERSTKRNRTIGNYSGIIHSIFGEGQEVFQQAVTSVDVTTFIKVEDGHALVLTGDSITTGSWDLTKAVMAKEYPRESGYWKAQVTFDAFSTLNFRWAVIREKDGKVQVMEKLCHSLYGRAAWLHAVAPWNLSHIFVVDTTVSLDSLDDLAGRTDLIVSERKQRFDEIKSWLNKANTGKTPSLVPLSQVPTPRPSVGQSTPTNTNKDLAKSAVMQMSNKAIPLPSQQQGHKPTVQPVFNLDEHSKLRQTRIDKLARRFSEEFKGSGTISKIKGTGQTDVAKESGEACDSLQQFPWNFQNATEIEVKCLVSRSDGTPTKAATRALSEEHQLQSSGHDGKRFVSTKKDENKSVDDEDSGVDSMSQPANVTRGTESTSSLIDSLELTYDLVSEGVSELMGQSKTVAMLKAFKATPSCCDAMAFTCQCQSNMEELSFGPVEDAVPAPEKLHDVTDFADFVIADSAKMAIVDSDLRSEPVVESEDMEREFLHLDWLSEKVEKEDRFVEKLTKHNDFVPFSDVNAKWKERETHGKRKNTTMMKSDARDEASVFYNQDSSVDGTALPWHKLPVFDGDGGPEEHPDLTNRREMARLLEEQWGSGIFQLSTSGVLLRDIQLSTPIMASPAVLAYQTDGSGELVSQSKGTNKVASYTNTELLNAVLCPTQTVDHRAVARMLEERWGKMTTIHQGTL